MKSSQNFQLNMMLTSSAEDDHLLRVLQHDKQAGDGLLSSASELGVDSLEVSLPLFLQLRRNKLKKEIIATLVYCRLVLICKFHNFTAQ